MKKRENRGLLPYFYQLGIITLFLGGVLVLVMFSAVSYRSAAAGRRDHDHSRVVISYLSTVLSSNRGSEVYTYHDSEIGAEVLAICDMDSVNGTRIYVYEGQLITVYGLLDSPLIPEDGIVLGDNTVFEITGISDDLIAVTTDEGTVYAHLINYRGER